MSNVQITQIHVKIEDKLVHEFKTVTLIFNKYKKCVKQKITEIHTKIKDKL